MYSNTSDTVELLGGYSPQYDVPGLVAANGGDNVLPHLFVTDKEATFAALVQHLLPRSVRPHTAAELSTLGVETDSLLKFANSRRKRKHKLTAEHLDIVSLSPERSTITFRIIFAENDPAADGATTPQRVIHDEVPAGYGPTMAQEMREGKGWVSGSPSSAALARCVEARRHVVEQQKLLDELIAAERNEFTDAVQNHDVSMYAIQEATAAAGVRISQQGVRKLITK